MEGMKVIGKCCFPLSFGSFHCLQVESEEKSILLAGSDTGLACGKLWLQPKGWPLSGFELFTS